MTSSKHFFFTISLLLWISIPGCKSGPKVISSDSGEAPHSEIFSGQPSTQTFNETNPPESSELHSVVVKDILPTNRYVYLQVEEGDESFWLATRKQDIVKGATYYYRNGLLKTNFESKEYNRTFDKIYLVSNLVPQNHGTNQATSSPLPQAGSRANTSSWTPSGTNSTASSGDFVSIAELTQNPQKYEGKTVRVHGSCVKVNPNIMGRNWVHLQDGSKDDFDLVITTDAQIQEGAKVKLSAVVGLNRDFGAGYTYSLILENGTLLP